MYISFCSPRSIRVLAGFVSNDELVVGMHTSALKNNPFLLWGSIHY